MLCSMPKTVCQVASATPHAAKPMIASTAGAYPKGINLRSGLGGRRPAREVQSTQAADARKPEYNTACHGVKNVSSRARLLCAHASSRTPAVSQAPSTIVIRLVR